MNMLALFTVLLASATTADDRRITELTRVIISDASEEARDAAAREIRAAGPAAFESVLAVGGPLPEGSEGRRRLVEFLASFGPEAYDELGAAALRRSSPYAQNRMLAAAAIREMGEDVLPAVVAKFAVLRHGYPDPFAYAVVLSFGSVAAPYLLPLADDPRPEIRQSVIGLLSTWKTSLATEAFLKAVESDDQLTREYAVQGLTRIREPRVLPIARKGIHDPNGPFRAASAVALFVLEPGSHRTRLVYLARSDEYVMARSIAARMLRESADDVSQRLGKRYDTVTVSPAYEPALERRRAFIVLFSAGVVFVVSALFYRLGWTPPGFQAVPPVQLAAGVGIALCGWWWGRWAVAINGETEYVFAFMSALSIWAARIGFRSRLQGAPAWLRRMWVAHMSAIAVGYFVGWMQLWGWSFDWVDLYHLWRQRQSMQP